MFSAWKYQTGISKDYPGIALKTVLNALQQLHKEVGKVQILPMQTNPQLLPSDLGCRLKSNLPVWGGRADCGCRSSDGIFDSWLLHQN